MITQPAVSGKNVEILFPAPYGSISNNHIYIIGYSEAPMVEIILNDRKQTVGIVKDSVFHFKIELPYGLNEIKVLPIFSGDSVSPDDTAFVEILSSPDIARKFRRIYPTIEFHNGEGKKSCEKCHAQVWSDLSVTKESSSCLECHTEFDEGRSLHVTEDKQNCSICHGSPEDLPSEYADMGTDNPCFFCHKDKIQSFDQEFVHGPVAGGACTVCHNPHGSGYDKSLVSAQEILCFSCHEFTQEMKEMMVQHRPFETGRCSSCHDPHATSNKWVLVKSSETVCLTCHNKDDLGMEFHRHPFNVKPKRHLNTDLELSSTGRLECLSCHNPHASQTKHLLRVTNKFICVGCHADRI